jgi:antitoxin component YwqK of YwqJK toxin-antitoxin module
MKKILFFYLLAHLGAQNNYELENLVIFEDKYLIKFTENLVEGDVFTTYTGQKVLNGRILKGVKEGKWVEWYETGTKKIEYNLIKGFLSGPIKLWSNKGTLLTSGSYIKGNGTTIIQNLDEYTLPTNGRNGNWEFYYENGQLKKYEEWENGILVSETEYYKNSKKVKYEAKYGDRNPDPDKQVILDYIGSIELPISSYTGLKTFYYSSGKPFSVQQWDWVQNRPYGKSLFYHESGEIWMEIQYNQRGKKHGYLKHYLLGKLYKKYFYNKDNIVTIETYDQNGDIEYSQDCVFKYCKEPTLATLDY